MELIPRTAADVSRLGPEDRRLLVEEDGEPGPALCWVGEGDSKNPNPDLMSDEKRFFLLFST